MQYCKYEEYFEGCQGITYLEIEDNWVVRQISKVNDKFISSNRKDPRYHFCLAEGEICIEDIDNIIIIDKLEFERVWNENNHLYLEEWKEIKKKYKVKEKVRGWIEVFYPQGVIINIEDKAFGIADYYECSDSTVPENLYPNHFVEAVIKGYDETNIWLILENTKVFKDELKK